MSQARQDAEDEVTLPDADVITPELVAKTISGISQIGYAQHALEQAGWDAIIIAKRITINKLVEAQLVTATDAMWWNVYAADGTPPIWVVGAQHTHEEPNWIGCVE